MMPVLLVKLQELDVNAVIQLSEATDSCKLIKFVITNIFLATQCMLGSNDFLSNDYFLKKSIFKCSKAKLLVVLYFFLVEVILYLDRLSNKHF